MTVALFAIRIDDHVKAPCLFVPLSQWTLNNLETDKLIARWIRHDTNTLRESVFWHASRPDLVRLHVAAGFEPGVAVKQGQCVAVLHSFEDQYQLTDLMSQIGASEANWASLSSGAKSALQEEADQNVNYARAQMAAFEPQFQRDRQLWEQKLISDAQWDVTRSTQELYVINVKLHEARLGVVRSGEKSEAIAVVQAQIAGLAKQAELLQQKLDAATIRAPFNGHAGYSTSEGVVCQIDQIDTLVAQIPVRPMQLRYLRPQQRVQIFAPVSGLVFETTVLLFSNQTTLIAGQPMFLVIAKFPNPTLAMVSGTEGIARIFGDKITLWQRIQRSWTTSRFRPF